MVKLRSSKPMLGVRFSLPLLLNQRTYSNNHKLLKKIRTIKFKKRNLRGLFWDKLSHWAVPQLNTYFIRYWSTTPLNHSYTKLNLNSRPLLSVIAQSYRTLRLTPLLLLQSSNYRTLTFSRAGMRRTLLESKNFYNALLPTTSSLPTLFNSNNVLLNLQSPNSGNLNTLNATQTPLYLRAIGRLQTLRRVNRSFRRNRNALHRRWRIFCSLRRRLFTRPKVATLFKCLPSNIKNKRRLMYSSLEHRSGIVVTVRRRLFARFLKIARMQYVDNGLGFIFNKNNPYIAPLMRTLYIYTAILGCYGTVLPHYPDHARTPKRSINYSRALRYAPRWLRPSRLGLNKLNQQSTPTYSWLVLKQVRYLRRGRRRIINFWFRKIRRYYKLTNVFPPKLSAKRTNAGAISLLKRRKKNNPSRFSKGGFFSRNVLTTQMSLNIDFRVNPLIAPLPSDKVKPSIDQALAYWRVQLIDTTPQGPGLFKFNPLFVQNPASYFSSNINKYLEFFFNSRVSSVINFELLNRLKVSEYFYLESVKSRLFLANSQFSTIFFVNEFLDLVYMALKLKNFNHLITYLNRLLKSLIIWEHKRFLLFFFEAFKEQFFVAFPDFGIVGLQLLIKGKIGVGGDSRKRSMVVRLGQLTRTATSVNTYTLNTWLNTNTGALGLNVKLFYLNESTQTPVN